MPSHLRLVQGGQGQSKGPNTPELTARQRLFVKTFLPLVEKHAVSIARRYPDRVNKNELLGPGTIALHEAAAAYREDQHPDFEQYARHHVRGRMFDAIRAEHFSPRARVERAMERSYERFATHQLLEVDTVMESDERILEDVERGCDDALAASVLAGLIKAQSHDPEALTIAAEEHVRTTKALKEGIDGLPPQERKVIRLVYERGLTLDEVALEISAHVCTAQRRHVAALRKIRAFLQARDIIGRPRDPRG